MGFNESKDEVLDSRLAIEDERTRIIVQLCRYDRGEVKVQLKRENRTKEGWTFAKLGRMTPVEFVESMPVGLELLEKHGLLDQAVRS